MDVRLLYLMSWCIMIEHAFYACLVSNEVSFIGCAYEGGASNRERFASYLSASYVLRGYVKNTHENI